MKTLRKVYFLFAATVLIVLNQLSKLWIVNHITLDTTQEYLPGISSLTYPHNYGATFSILRNQQRLFAVITFTVVGAACYHFVKNISDQFWFLLGLILTISGGLGSFVNRVRLGYVVDMIHLDFMNLTVFNMTDSYLTVGIVILFITLWKEEENGVNH